ncbi:MAG TPA: DUF4162 domain-containing protein, partial [Ferruginibacter sp.]|nr:DUF4162 domain-containing protein [Ferruginibacter sp.]
HKADHILLKLDQDTMPNDVLSHFIRQGVQIHSFQEVLPSLNDIFIKLVEGTPSTRQFQELN